MRRRANRFVVAPSASEDLTTGFFRRTVGAIDRTRAMRRNRPSVPGRSICTSVRMHTLVSKVLDRMSALAPSRHRSDQSANSSSGNARKGYFVSFASSI